MNSMSWDLSPTHGLRGALPKRRREIRALQDQMSSSLAFQRNYYRVQIARSLATAKEFIELGESLVGKEDLNYIDAIVAACDLTGVEIEAAA